MGWIVDGLTKIKRMGDPILRDFTPSAETRMINISSRVNKNETAGDKYVTDAIGRFLDKKGYLYLMDGIINYEESVIDSYNYGAETIKEICEMARECDHTYGQSIGINDSNAEHIGKILNELAECIDINSEVYDPRTPVSERLYLFNEHWYDDGDYKVGKVTEEINNRHKQRLPNEISSEEILEFCKEEGVEVIFEEYTDYIYDQMKERGFLTVIYTTTGTVIHKGVEMTVSEFMALVTKEDYMDNLVRQNLNSIITNMINESKDFTTFVKDHGAATGAMEDWLKKLQEANKEGTISEDLKPFAEFVKKMGGIETFKSLLKNSPQLLDYLFNDYQKGLEILEQIKVSCDRSGCSEMREAIKRLMQDYDKKWNGVLRNAKDFMEDVAKGKAKNTFGDWIEKNCESGSILTSLLEFAINEEDIEAEHKLIALRKIESDLEESYKDVIEKIRSGEYDEEDIKHAKNMFNALKETELSIYKTYLELCDEDPQEQIRINKYINKLERLNMQYPDPWKFSG